MCWVIVDDAYAIVFAHMAGNCDTWRLLHDNHCRGACFPTPSEISIADLFSTLMSHIHRWGATLSDLNLNWGAMWDVGLQDALFGPRLRHRHCWRRMAS